ncbi:MAG: Spy/CpxP family protein refolding chaperone [Anaerolineae bacterium]|nr:Spy/CpxP family protein refolding chaperone [Phycisphaerae bacterium]
MSRLKMILTVAFVLAMGAGVAVGMFSARYPQSHQPRSWLGDELNLSPEQREQMRTIWQDVSKNRPRDGDRRRALEKERNEAIVGLLNEEQKLKYEQINQQFVQRMQEQSQQREAAMQSAIERTMQMLTPEQRVKYEQIMQERREKKERDRENRDSGEKNGGGSHRSPTTNDAGARISQAK